MAQLVLETGTVFGDWASIPAKAQRHRQHGQVRREQTTQLHQRPAGAEVRTKRDEPGDAECEPFRPQFGDGGQETTNKTYPASDPAYGAREFDRVATQRFRCRRQAPRALGMGDDRFQRVEGSGKTCRQTVWQQAESRVALPAIPASNLRATRGLPRVGAVACQRTSAVRVIRAALKPCIAPRSGGHILLAGELRRVAKLHRPRDSEERNRLYPPRHDGGRGSTALATGASCSSMLSSVAAGSCTGQPAQTGSISVA